MCISYDRLRRALPVCALALALVGCEAKRDLGVRAASSERAAQSPLPDPLPRAEGTEKQRGPLVVFLGDSLAAGLHLPAEQAFTALIQRQPQSEGNARIAVRITNSGLRMNRMIEDLLDFTRIRLGQGLPIEPTSIDLAEIARSVADEIGSRADDRRVVLEHTGGIRGWAGDSPLIHLDTAKIRALGWAPTASIREAVVKTLEWLEENR